MKRMTILLSAATLALVPLTSNAKKGIDNPDFGVVTVESCSCTGPELSSEPGFEGDMYKCTVKWPDVIGPPDDRDPATYGASLDVELLDPDTEEEQSLDAELDYDWWSSEPPVCSDGTCTVTDAPFVLTNYSGQTVTVSAAVKAFKTGRNGMKPRNFKKEPLPCDLPLDE